MLLNILRFIIFLKLEHCSKKSSLLSTVTDKSLNVFTTFTLIWELIEISLPELIEIAQILTKLGFFTVVLSFLKLNVKLRSKRFKDSRC